MENISVVQNAKTPPVNRENKVPQFDIGDHAVSEQQKAEASGLIAEYRDIFSVSNTDLGRTSLVKHSIETNGSKPIKQPARRIPMHLIDEVERQTQDMLRTGLIEKSRSPWSSPIVLVRKKDGSIRFCVDYRRLNAVTHKDAHPLPRIDECLDKLGGATIFSTMDLTSGYFQVELEENDREKSAFSTGHNLFQFRVLPMGLTNSPATFQRLMNLVLGSLDWRSCLVFLDDIIVIGRSFEEHMGTMRQVFDCLRQAGLKLKPAKCHLFKEKVICLGHQVSRNGVEPDPANTEKVRLYPRPTSPGETRSFLGLASYYRRFIQGFSKIAVPLNRLTQKDVQFEWSQECETAFQFLKTSLVTPPVLGYPECNTSFRLYTDASNEAVGAVLCQEQKGKERVIAYASSSLTNTERRWCAYDKEFWALLWAIRHFRPYLSGRPFEVITDHKPLLNVKTIKAGNDPTGRRERWSIELSVYDFTVKHREGRSHGNADTLSRLPQPVNPAAEVACGSLQSGLHVGCQERGSPAVETVDVEAKFAAKQRQDKVLKLIIQAKMENADRQSLQGNTPELRSLLTQWDRLIVTDDILYRRWEDEDGIQSWLQPLVPRSCVEEVLTAMHGCPIGGHFGQEKTLEKVRKRYYWFGLRKDVLRWCEQCIDCAQSKSTNYTPRAPLVVSAPSYPMERIALDILGPLPVTGDKNRYILVIMDYFTKWVEAFAIPDHKAETIAKQLVDQVICRFGAPRMIHTDQGRDFESHLFAGVCQLLGISKTRTTPYHPQSDGLVENFNKTLGAMLRTVVSENQKDWDVLLPKVLLAYRSSVQSTTKFTPHFLMCGREVCLPLDVMYGGSGERCENIVQHVQDLSKKMEYAYEKVRDNLGVAQERQKHYYDQKTAGPGYQLGDLVMLYTPAVKKGRSRKLSRKWNGPYKIIKVITEVVYRLQKVGGRYRTVVHYNRLRPYAGQIQEPAIEQQVPGNRQSSEPSRDPSEVRHAQSQDVRTGPGLIRMPQFTPLTAHTRGRPLETPVPVGNQSEADDGADDGDSVGGGDLSLDSSGGSARRHSDTGRDNSDTGDLRVASDQSSSSEGEEEMVPDMVPDTWTQQRTRTGRVTRRPVQYGDFVLALGKM